MKHLLCKIKNGFQCFYGEVDHYDFDTKVLHFQNGFEIISEIPFPQGKLLYIEAKIKSTYPKLVFEDALFWDAPHFFEE